MPNTDPVDYTDQDPQSARAAQGFTQNFLDSGPKTQDSIQPESSPIDTAVSLGVAPMTNALASGAEGVIGNEVGAIGPNLNTGIGNAATSIGEAVAPAGYADKEQAAMDFLKKAQDAFKAGKASNTDVSYAMQAYKSAQRVAQRNKMADGGQVHLDIGLPQDHGHSIPTGDNTWEEGNLNGYADGGAISGEPEGLDAFLAGTPQPSNQIQSNTVQGNPISSEPEGLDDFLGDDLKNQQLQDKYGDVPNQIKAGLEGAAQGIAGPLATEAELQAGVKPEDMRGREEANPFISNAGKIAGLGGSMFMGVGEGKLAIKTGELASDLVKGSGLAAKVGQAAADGAVQSILISGGDEITKALREDPDSSMQSAAVNVGLSGLMGGAISGALGTVSPLWKATFGDDANQVISDFNSRMAEHATGTDPVANVTKELTDHWENTNMVADPVYGANGLKAQEIAKAMPEFNENMTAQASSLTQRLEDTLNDMNAKPNKFPPRLADKIADVTNDLKASLIKSESPADIFNSIQNAKQTLQGFAKFDRYVTPVDEGHGFVQAAKKLQFEFRNALEDTSVWDKAAKAQQDINSAATDFFKSSKDFQSKFTSKIQGEPIVDPGKVATYMNQLGKPSAEIKSSVLQNYLDASEKYRGKISDIHNNLGIDNPVNPSSLNAVNQTFNKPTTGAKLADALVAKGLQSAGGKGIGAGIGSLVGGKSGLPGGEFLGALVGSHVLGPFISSVMPLIAKPLMNGVTSSVGFKAASDASLAMIRGQGVVSRATKALFQAGKDVLPSALAPSAAKLAKLDKLIANAIKDPDSISEGPTNIAHYMPEHGTAASAITGKAVSFLAPLRPNQDKKAPLDSQIPPSTTSIANYNRQLENAEQPLMLLKRIKDGSLTSKDLLTVQTIYPDLYKTMAMQIMDNMAAHLAKGNPVAYQTRIGLSKFAVQPLDSTLSPMSIMAAQPQPQMPQPPGEQPGKGKPRKGAGGTALNKLSSSYQTQSQALSAKHEKSDV